MNKLKASLDKDEELAKKQGSQVLSQDTKQAMKEYDNFVKVVNPMMVLVNRICSLLSNLRLGRSYIGMTIDTKKGGKIGKNIGTKVANKIGAHGKNKKTIQDWSTATGMGAGFLASYEIRNSYSSHVKPININAKTILNDKDTLKSRYNNQAIVDINERTNNSNTNTYNKLLLEITEI